MVQSGSRKMRDSEWVGNWSNRTNGKWTADAEPQSFSLLFLLLHNLFTLSSVFTSRIVRIEDELKISSWRKTRKIIRRNCLDYRKPFFVPRLRLCISVISFVPLLAHSLKILQFILEYDSGRLFFFWHTHAASMDENAFSKRRPCGCSMQFMRQASASVKRSFFLYILFFMAVHGTTHLLTRLWPVCAALGPYVQLLQMIEFELYNHINDWTICVRKFVQ